MALIWQKFFCSVIRSSSTRWDDFVKTRELCQPLLVCLCHALNGSIIGEQLQTQQRDLGSSGRHLKVTLKRDSVAGVFNGVKNKGPDLRPAPE